MEELQKMDIDPNKFVVMANDLVKGKSALSLNSAKLIRLSIMQCEFRDNELKPYQISIKDFAAFLGIRTEKGLYRDIQDICIQLLKEIVLIGDGNPKHKWKAFQWVSQCDYDNGIISIRLHDDLKPYLLNLKGCYTQYEIENILTFKSVHALRIYELIKMELRNVQIYGEKEIDVYLSVDMIKKATNTEKKYKKMGDFNKNVIEIAVKEINEKPYNIRVSYKYRKEGRKIVGYDFHIKSWGNGMVLSDHQKQVLEAIIEKKERHHG